MLLPMVLVVDVTGLDKRPINDVGRERMLLPLPPLLLVVAGGVPDGVEEDEEEEAAPMP